MGIGTFFYLALIAGVLFFTGVGLVWIINNNFRTGQRIREVLQERIQMLRLGRMLKKRGISTETFLHETPVYDIESNIRNCESCGQVKKCDAALDVSAPGEADLSFCPNDDAFNKYSRLSGK